MFFFDKEGFCLFMKMQYLLCASLTLAGVSSFSFCPSGTRWNRCSTILFISSTDMNPLLSVSNLLNIINYFRGSVIHLKICLSLDWGVPWLITETITKNSCIYLLCLLFIIILSYYHLKLYSAVVIHIINPEYVLLQLSLQYYFNYKINSSASWSLNYVPGAFVSKY